MTTVLLTVALLSAAIQLAEAQPGPGRQPPASNATSQSAAKTAKLAKATAERKSDIASRIARSAVDRRNSGVAKPIANAVDKQLTSAATPLQQQFDAIRLKQVHARKSDPQFIGVIDSVMVDGTEITLERRRVRTDRGVQTLILNRVGHQYVYDGDQVVPVSVVEGATFSGFSAGYAGTFGRGSLWDDALIPFETESAFCCNDALIDAIALYETKTKFRFVPRNGHETYVRFVNAFPFTTSRTSVGKHHGENQIEIQGTSNQGQPHDPVDLSAGIQHEIGHKLGLIHEHLRSDRDDFIARNTSCNSTNAISAIYNGWIDLGQTAFTDDRAELLTAYDFDSIMHYSFVLDKDGDGVGDCSAWVRKESCPNDPTSSTCDTSFSSISLTPLDIEGLHKLYVAVPADLETRPFTADNVRHRGRRIDRCLHGLNLGEDGCSVESRARVADEYCKTQGFEHGFDVQTQGLIGEASGFDVHVGWKNVWSADVISSIVCENLTDDNDDIAQGQLRAKTFAKADLKVASRFIDRCVHGSGITGDRCSTENQQRIADRFCTLQRFDQASGFATDFAIEVNAIGFFPSTNNFANVSATDVFTEIRCVAADTTSSSATVSLPFRGNEVSHRGRRIDRCVQGLSFREDGCSLKARARVAKEFCRTKGFLDASNIQVAGDVGNHSIFDAVVSWKTGLGTDIISSVECSRLTADAEAVEAKELESRTFQGPQVKVSSRFIDRCVHGGGVGGDRCSRAKQRAIANKFCKREDFDHASQFQTDTQVEINAIGFFPSTDQFQNVSSTDVFTEITCVKPSGS